MQQLWTSGSGQHGGDYREKALRHICQQRATTGPLSLMEGEEV